MTNETLDLGRVIRRDALLTRLSRLRPDFVSLVAPAGFGKSTLAMQYVAAHERVGVCDCAGVVDDLDFARRLIFSLADEQPERGAALAQCELMLGESTLGVAERIALAVGAWRESSPRSAFIFEDVEQIANVPSAFALFARLLAERPASRTIIICSRETLRLHVSRFAPPHRIVALHAGDLAFTLAEIENLFEPLGLDRAVLQRIFEVSGGWPIPVLFLARLATEGRLDAVLARLDGIAYEELYEYLADQVIDALPPPIRTSLIAAASIPDATAADLALATGEAATAALTTFARTSPFVRVNERGVFVVHPFMRAMLVEDGALERDALLARIAERHAQGGDHLRAAELHAARGDQPAAAQALECVPVGDDHAPSMRYSRMVSALDRTLVHRFPTLWTWMALMQTFSIESERLLEEAEVLWASLDERTPLNKRFYVLAIRVLLLTYLGAFDAARDVIEGISPRAAIPAVPVTREQGYALFLHGTVLGRLGRIAEAERDLALAWPLINSMDAMASATLVVQATEIHRVRGDWDRERSTLERSLAVARDAGLAGFVCFRLAERALSAWLHDDAAGVAANIDELEQIVVRDGVRGFAFFVDCVRGRHAAPAAPDLARFVLCGYLIAAAQAETREDAIQRARRAAQVAERHANPFLQTLATLALGELASGAERDDAHARARAAAALSAAPQLEAAVRCTVAGDASGTMLEQFVRRYRRVARPASPRLAISMLAGTVAVRGAPVKLSDRELALILALARRRSATSREELIDMLWPDHEADTAINSLNVCVHRARAHLGEDAVERTRDGVRLCDDAVVDLWEIERAGAMWRAKEIASDADAAAVRALSDRLRVERPVRFSTWEWFDRIERSIQELRCELSQRLARYALAMGRCDEALNIAHEMIAYDACHEVAHEIAIAAHNAAGDAAAALHHYRQYRETLLNELECEPSAALKALLHDPVARG